MTAAALTVRPAHPEDLDAMAGLEKAAFQDSWPREMLEYEVVHPRAVLLIASRGEAEPPAGYAAFRHAAGEAELLRLAVLPAERRRGIARALIAEGLERLRQADVQICFLEVRKDNTPAIALYESLGFTRTGQRKEYYRDGTDALIYVAELYA
ncbi:MAG TPA: ribosomal protein S18-alanine N-acetyltransferase [Thermoanaerobaculia bacterium]|nr:ribosomal protein S18-alanine N-acetyltransferase [Thermoanaerobaculia bacterium]